MDANQSTLEPPETEPTEKPASPKRGEPRKFRANPVGSIYSQVTRQGLARYISKLPLIDRFEAELKDLSDRDLRKYSLGLRHRAKSGEPLHKLLPEAFALVRIAGARTMNMRHYEVQLIGGMIMFDGSIAEMETGEGKTLTATLPTYLYALPGKGVHVATVNDYLAARDAELMMPVYKMLGMSVGIIESQMSSDDRRKAYACDITYGTSKEFGFDFLRDRLLIRQTREQGLGVLGPLLAGKAEQNEEPVQREHYFALVDEADSVLIDDARTPLVISSIPGEAEKVAVACHQWAAQSESEFEEDEHYEYDHDKKSVELTVTGRLLVRQIPKPKLLDTVGLIDLYDYVERAIKVKRDFHSGQHYVIREGEVVHCRRIDRTYRRGKKVELWHPPGDRSEGRSRGHCGDRPGRSDHGAGPLSALSPPGRHDRYGFQFQRGIQEDLSAERDQMSHEPNTPTEDLVRSRVWQ